MGTVKTLRIITLSLLSALAMLTASVAADEPAEAPSLYERLGAADGLEKIVRDTIALHHENPDIAHYFADVDDDVLAGHVIAFFAAGICPRLTRPWISPTRTTTRPLPT